MMENIINLAIPHLGEHIFEATCTQGLIQCRMVSTLWKDVAEKTLLKRWKGKIFEASQDGFTEVVKLLLECDRECIENINTKDGDGMTPFLVACKNGRSEVVKLFLDHPGSNIEYTAKDNEDRSAFLLACQYGNAQTVKLLMKYAGDSYCRSKCMFNVNARGLVIHRTQGIGIGIGRTRAVSVSAEPRQYR